MLLLFLFLWTIGIIILIADRHRESNRWLSTFVFSSGLGGLSVELSEKHDFIASLFSSIAHNFAPYTLLMFSVHYSGLINVKGSEWKRKLPYILLIPIIIMYVIFPVYPQFHPSFIILSLWTVPYILGANAMLIYAYLQEQNKQVKTERLSICLMVVPGTLFVMITNYILRAIEIHTIWMYNTWVVAIIFLIFIVLLIKRGIMGLRIRFEKKRLDSNMKAITSGTMMITHTIKNELVKISMCTENIKSSVNATKEGIDDNAEIILKSTNHLLAMTNKINDKLDALVIEKRENNLKSLTENTLEILKPCLQSKDVKVIKHFQYKGEIICDETHIREVLINIIRNAIEAVQTGGEIVIEIFQARDGVTLTVKDNGKGIPKHYISKVIEPFFTTKENNNNFGLGLSYCYNVIRQHEGKLEIDSKENKGTTVRLIFQNQ
ncbi:sensor histidine kinase [Desulfuribacillus alkaliarsenatis]|uniref:histidine kinase n=1 Tax=Desulfuribacillus alkaliarsenatis TaxID=766136 RepID=A0A1E5G5R2_9FIRM|nr:HAMP domain-containing sensor histidine kinase [Desulfuribacillus alkaliarsenatis]OEF98114.1 hypothetical protein BHF68_00015 [Desulfuribacillus alkaliarsenatis]